MKHFAYAVAVSLASAAAVPTRDAAEQAPRSARDGVYTIDQAQRGKGLYDEKCASCHGVMTSTTPGMAPLLNDHVFQARWTDRTVGDLFDRIRTTMPQNEEGTLSSRHTAAIVAYILSANQLPAGGAELGEDVETLKRIRLDSVQP